MNKARVRVGLNKGPLPFIFIFKSFAGDLVVETPTDDLMTVIPFPKHMFSRKLVIQ